MIALSFKCRCQVLRRATKGRARERARDVCASVHVCVCMRVSVCVSVHVSKCACLSVCLSVCLYMCVSVRGCLYVRVPCVHVCVLMMWTMSPMEESGSWFLF